MTRVLIVEDDEDVREAIDALLHDVPFGIHLAANGSDGLKLYRLAKSVGEPFGLLLLDGGLPDISGYAMAEEIRREGDDATPIIFFTAHSEPMARARAHLAHARDFWLKPAVLPELKERLTAVLAEIENDAAQV